MTAVATPDIVTALKAVLEPMAMEMQRLDRVARYHRDPMQADNAAKVLRREMLRARAICAAIELVRAA